MLLHVLQQGSKMAYRPSNGNCGICNHPSCQCSGDCEICLRQIHFPWNYPGGRRDYDCQNMIYYYACKFMAKYASEIFRLLRRSALIPELPEYRVLSIGCGPAPDLAALELLSAANSNLPQIDYCGLDINLRWQPLHELAEAYSIKNVLFNNCEFIYGDAITNIVRNPAVITGPNIIVLQYFLSTLAGCGIQDSPAALFSLIENRYAVNAPLVIALSDINHTSTTNLFDILFNKLQARFGARVAASRYHFDTGNLAPCQIYGDPHYCGLNIEQSFNSTLDLSFCNPWTYCTAAQMLIEIR